MIAEDQLTTTHPWQDIPDLVALLRQRALEQPDQPAYTFLMDGESHEISISYAALDCQARAIAARLRQLVASGERALLLYPPGLDYIAAFFGCLYAGVVAVPAYPPNPAQLARTLPRLRAITTDARPLAALTNAPILSIVESMFAQDADFRALHWLANDTLPPHLANDWHAPPITGDTLAFLQYTSGSTATPKGVMVSHGNLLHNERLIQHAFGHTGRSVVVGWLPMYHDMGLIGNVLQPLYLGAHCILMSPVDFLQKPGRWLQAITRYRATTSGGPNFAYDLCVRKIRPEQRAELDLSSWSLAFNGAEPVRPDTLDRFVAAFAECGFRKEALYPCYGLAEATLFVTGNTPATPPLLHPIQRTALARNQAITAVAPEDTTTLVSSGSTRLDQQVRIVDPATASACPAGQIGEIWIAGPSVAQGYWNRPEETARVFQARLAGGAGPFLRTGDLGYLHAGELFVTGRLKDLIIIRGRNHYPQDIELTVERSHPALRPGCGAAFSIEVAGEERLAIVQELDRQYRHGDLDQVIEAIRQAISAQHEVLAHAVVLIKTGTIPKTSSGKLQRHACREGFLRERLDVIASSVLDATLIQEAGGAPALDRATLLQAEPADRLALLERYLAEQLERAIGVAPEQVPGRRPVSTLGLDSLMAIEVQYAIEQDLGVVLPMVDLLQGRTVAALAQQALDLLADTPAARAIGAARRAGSTQHPLSYGQQALWFMHQIAPESQTNTMAFAARVRSELDPAALEQAFQQLVERHAGLRTTFDTAQGSPVQQIQARMPAAFLIEDAAGWSETELHERLAAAARRPFDLGAGPVLRVVVYTRSPHEHILLLALPHLAADFWSLVVLVQELSLLYGQARRGQAATLAPVALEYTDYVYWEADLLAGARGEELWDYWQRQLAGAPARLDLPTDWPRPAIQTYHGASERLTLPADLTRRLKAFGEERGVTLFVSLLAAFQVLLHHYSGQDDILVGAPMTGRGRAELAGLVGSLARPVVLRAQLAEGLTFESFVDQAHQTVLDALAHQEYPFARLVERLQPARDPSRSPLFQVMFNFLGVHLAEYRRLAACAIGLPGVQVQVGELALESLALDQPLDHFDLSLLVAEVAGELHAALQYNANLFNATTIARMAEHLRHLLDRLLAGPEQPLHVILGELPGPRQVVTIAATFTAEPAGESLGFWMEHLRIPATIRFAPYNQIFQQLLEPASLIAANRDGVNVLLLRLEDWGATYQDRASIERNVQDFTRTLAALAARAPATYLIGICPASLAANGDPATREFLRSMEQHIVAELGALNGIYLLDPAGAAARYRVAEPHDPFTDAHGHIPYTPAYFAALGATIARALSALRHPPLKVIAVDCDQTLWKGVCGEDGPLGVELDAPRRRLQEFLVAQHEQGVLLCLCSKNNQEDVFEVFRQRPDMPLKLEHFVAWRINWAPKSENLRALADELQLGLDSFALIDDSPLECAEVQAGCPDLLVLPLPARTDDIPAFLDHIWAFDRLRITAEDTRRTLLYGQHRQREQFRATATTLEAFLAGLALEVDLAPMQPAHVARVAELTQRTNQFNATTIRRTEAEIHQLLAAGTTECWIVEARDRFGEYGLVGVLIFAVETGTLHLDTFLLSCRVLGRRVEDILLSRLADLATERGCARIALTYRPTRKNAPFLQFVRRLGLELPLQAGESFVGTFPVQMIAAAARASRAATPVETAPVAHSNTSQAEHAHPGAPGTQAPNMYHDRLRTIAAELQTADQIVRAMRDWKQAGTLTDQQLEPAGHAAIDPQTAVAPRNAVESVVARIWAELLGFDRFGVHDDFFAVGGHSILAMQVASRVREAFQTEFPMRMFFASGAFTIAEIAKTISMHQMAQATPEALTALLDELDGLSDDEIALLLSEDEDNLMSIAAGSSVLA